MGTYRVSPSGRSGSVCRTPVPALDHSIPVPPAQDRGPEVSDGELDSRGGDERQQLKRPEAGRIAK